MSQNVFDMFCFKSLFMSKLFSFTKRSVYRVLHGFVQAKFAYARANFYYCYCSYCYCSYCLKRRDSIKKWSKVTKNNYLASLIKIRDIWFYILRYYLTGTRYLWQTQWLQPCNKIRVVSVAKKHYKNIQEWWQLFLLLSTYTPWIVKKN